MRRREFLSVLGVTAATSLLFSGATPALAQTPNKVYRLGHLTNSLLSETLTRETTLPELARLGFVEGRNLVFDARVGDAQAMPGIMRELLDPAGRGDRHRRGRDRGRRGGDG